MDKRKRPAPFSLRLTFEQRARLETLAEGMSLSAYIHSRIFTPGARPRATVKDREALLRVLAQLGQSRLANNLNQLARAANIGALPVDPETEAELKQAVADVAAMRAALMTALGMDATP